MVVLVFWTAATILVYAYLGFPLLTVVRGLVIRRPYAGADYEPNVSVIIAAHNEAADIGAKIENVLSLDYPRDRLEVVVASDGSNDGTNEIVERYEDRGVRLLRLTRRGKIPCLNTAVKAASGEVLVFSDANSILNGAAIRALARPLADPKVGGVAGDQRYLRGSDASGERAYWTFDRLLKQMQSRSGSVTSATGALYAIRQPLYQPPPPCVTDDFAISTGVIEQGYRLVFAPDAIAFEPVAKARGVEYGRKVRVMTRGLQGVILRRTLLNPRRYGFYAVQIFSHKVLRRLAAVLLVTLMATSLFLWPEGLLYRAVALGGASILALAAIGAAAEGTRVGRNPVIAIPYYFIMVNLAALAAVFNTLRGRRIERWDPQRDVSPTVCLNRIPEEST